MIIAVAICSGLGFVFTNRSVDSAAGPETGQVLSHSVLRSDFEYVVTETGDVESASNDEVRCQVKSVSGSSSTILDIVDEGVFVEQGDFLIQFDDAGLDQALTQQEIVVATDEATVIDTQSELAKAEKALIEYRNGIFSVERETLKGELFQAESFLKTVEDSLIHTQRIFKKGYASKTQLEADQLAVRMADKAARVSEIKLKVLEEYTFDRMISEYEADIAKQKAILKAAQNTLKLSQQRRDELADQLAKCRVAAPRDGQVVYANDYGRKIVIEEGVQVRQGQVVIRLPDPNQMQVDTKINDSKINRITVGSPCRIVLDVNPDLEIEGVLSSVEPFPYPRRWHGAPIEYGAVVELVDPPASLRPGQRAKVNIVAEQRKAVLQVPVQSVEVRDGRQFCVVRNTQGLWEIRPIVAGPNNDSFVVIESGLKEGEQVALNPERMWDDVTTGTGMLEATPVPADDQ